MKYWETIETIPQGVPVLTRRRGNLFDVATVERHGPASGIHKGNGVFLCKVTHWAYLPADFTNDGGVNG